MPVYEEPIYEAPSVKQKLGKYERVLEPLMSTPGAWAKVATLSTESSAYQASLNLRKGRYKIPGDPSDWDFTNDGQNVHAMYLVDNADNNSS